MKYLPLIYKNILRNRRRTILIFVSLFFSLFLYVFLFTMLSSMNMYFDIAKEQQIIYAYSTYFDIKNHNFPQSYIPKIREIPHVIDITPCIQMLNYFEKSTKVINTWGINSENFGNFFEITRIEGTTWSRFAQEKTAGLVGKNLLKEYGWKIGDRIILKSGLAGEISFTIRGIVHGLGNVGNFVYLNLPYLQELMGNQGRVSFILIKTEDSYIQEVCSKIETEFRNYPVELTAITQKSFLESIVAKIRAMLIAFRLIGWIAIISTFLLVTNCIAISIRERTAEIGVMRVLGFSRSRILILVLAESIGVALTGGMTGALLAYLIPKLYHIEVPATVPLVVNADINLLLYALLISTLIGFLGGMIPSLNIALMKPSEAIRNIG